MSASSIAVPAHRERKPVVMRPAHGQPTTRHAQDSRVQLRAMLKEDQAASNASRNMPACWSDDYREMETQGIRSCSCTPSSLPLPTCKHCSNLPSMKSQEEEVHRMTA